jgi:hypothetical protein
VLGGELLAEPPEALPCIVALRWRAAAGLVAQPRELEEFFDVCDQAGVSALASLLWRY